METIRRFAWTRGEKAVACDFNHMRRLTTLLRLPSNELNIEIDGVAYALPADWGPHVARARWAGEEVLLWPIDSPVGGSPHVGRIGPNGADVLDLAYPLDVFSDLDLVACTYSEERVANGADLLSIFSSSNLQVIARFNDSLVAGFEEPIPAILEVEHGVLDGSAKRFWFTAYPTENLWCFSLEARRIAACKLRYPRHEALAITCRGDQASVVVRQQSVFIIQKYRHVGGQLIFDSQVEAPSQDPLWGEALEKLSESSGELRGRPGDMIALMTETSALLASI